MYSTCLFCQASLGKNDAIEHFPVGRRLAYDAEKGRLWVVCRKCARWNLTPLEERWEAIEESERAFSNTRMRVSTDNVGLARLPDGLELVRIGKPQRPEFAAWRYGDDFGRRRRKTLILSGMIGAGVLAKYVGVPLGIAGGATSALYATAMGVSLFLSTRARARVAVPGEKRPAIIRTNQLEKIRIVADSDRLTIRMPMDGGDITGAGRQEVTIEGEPALRAAATILTASNHAGANKTQLNDAVRIVSENLDPLGLFQRAIREVPPDEPLRSFRMSGRKPRAPDGTRVTEIPEEMRLALEMATNEDIERRAMEGELAILEAAGRQAEEIAAIADNLDLGKPGDISARSDG